MNRKQIAVLVLVITLLFSLGVVIIKPTYATDYWNDTIDLFPNIVSFKTGVREITNTGVYPLKIVVEYYTSSNISNFATFYLTGNGTTFISILNGVVTKSECTVTLGTGQKLSFDIESSPSGSVGVGETSSVTTAITRSDVVDVGSTSPLIPIVPIPVVFDILIISLPGRIVALWTEQTLVTIRLINKGAIAIETSLSYWIENSLNKTLYTETRTILIYSNETRDISVGFPTPREVGAYTFHTEAVSPEIEVSALKTFQIISAPNWFAGADGLPWTILIIVIICTVVGIICYAKKKGSRRLKWKRTHWLR